MALLFHYIVGFEGGTSGSILLLKSPQTPRAGKLFRAPVGNVWTAYYITISAHPVNPLMRHVVSVTSGDGVFYQNCGYWATVAMAPRRAVERFFARRYFLGTSLLSGTYAASDGALASAHKVINSQQNVHVI